MKKIFLITLLYLLFPLITYAADYDITKYNIEANIEDNGNVNVCEYLKLDGIFNGYVRDVFYKMGDTNYTPTNISDIKIYDINTYNMSKGEIFSYDDYAKVGESLKYNIKNYTNGPSIKMFNSTNGGTKGFVLCYTLENAVLVHNDVAEVYYTFIPSGFEDLLNNVTVKVNLSEVENTLRVWAHGALYGNVSKQNTNTNSYLLSRISYVNPGEVVNIRMTFDKKLVKNSTRLTYKNSLDEIIKEETKLADEANKIRLKNKFIVYGCVGEFILFVLFLVYSVIYCYIKYDKEHKVGFDMEYYRDFPNNYGPEFLEYLIKKNNTPDSYSASILNMIYKKNIIITETDDKKDYILKKAEKFIEPLTESEGIILDFIINDIGDGKEVSLKEIKKYGKTESKAKKFIKHFDNWKNEVKKVSLEYNFYETQKEKSFFIINVIIFTFITFIVGGTIGKIVFIPFLSVIIGTGTLIYILTISKRTKSGMLEYKKWMAFKKFLLDFGRFDEKELPEIILWEKYLVYATVFGIAKNLEKTMKIKIKSFNENDTNLTDVILMNHMIRSNFTHTMNSTITNAYNVSRSTIASSSS